MLRSSCLKTDVPHLFKVEEKAARRRLFPLLHLDKNYFFLYNYNLGCLAANYRKNTQRSGFMIKKDVLIIGAGPAGIFTALEMLRNGSKKAF